MFSKRPVNFTTDEGDERCCENSIILDKYLGTFQLMALAERGYLAENLQEFQRIFQCYQNHDAWKQKTGITLTYFHKKWVIYYFSELFHFMCSKTLWASIKQRKCDKKGSIEHVLTFTPKLAKWSHKLDLRDGPYVASSRMNSRINVYGMWLSNISLHVQQATKTLKKEFWPPTK